LGNRLGRAILHSNCALDHGRVLWKTNGMNAVEVDRERRIQLGILTPGDLYEPEILSVDEITLHRVPRLPQPRKLTKLEALKAIEESPLRFRGSWEQLRQETRE
jgi:hypothetical protein